jgi:CSLREA domain-containing protein
MVALLRKIILLSFPFFLWIVSILLSRAAGSVIVVSTTDDSIADDGLCSLREAVISANTDRAVGGCESGAGADTIQFSPSLTTPATIVLSLAGAGEDNASTGDLDLQGNLTIQGAGVENILLDGNSSDRVLEIRPGAKVTLAGVTLRHGNPGPLANGGGLLVDVTAVLTVTNSLVFSNSAALGGGVYNRGALNLVQSSIQGNSHGGLYNDGGAVIAENASFVNNLGGYAIINVNNASLVMNSSILSGNQGGGVENSGSNASLTGVQILNNTLGGGVYNHGSFVTNLHIQQSLIQGNSATSGGGVHNAGVGATATIQTTRLAANSAAVAGGAVFNNGIMTLTACLIDQNSARTGGGVDQYGGSLTLTNVTLSGNTASDNGGGMYIRHDASLVNVTLNANQANGQDTGGNLFNEWQVSLRNTIVANSDVDGNCYNSGGWVNSLGNNLDTADTCGFHSSGDLINTPAQLAPLADNGGPTWTHALLTTSPAIDHGSNIGCPLADQRGEPRPVDGDHDGQPICDMGAFEYDGVSTPLTPRLFLPLLLRP